MKTQVKEIRWNQIDLSSLEAILTSFYAASAGWKQPLVLDVGFVSINPKDHDRLRDLATAALRGTALEQVKDFFTFENFAPCKDSDVPVGYLQILEGGLIDPTSPNVN